MIKLIVIIIEKIISIWNSNNTGDLNKALKDLVNVITDQEIVQSDLNDEEDEIQ